MQADEAFRLSLDDMMKRSEMPTVKSGGAHHRPPNASAAHHRPLEAVGAHHRPNAHAEAHHRPTTQTLLFSVGARHRPKHAEAHLRPTTQNQNLLGDNKPKQKGEEQTDESSTESPDVRRKDTTGGFLEVPSGLSHLRYDMDTWSTRRSRGAVVIL